jgi:hypothetical protein
VSFCRDKSIKVVNSKAWFYYIPRTENFMNYYCGKKYKMPPVDASNLEPWKDKRHDILS